ncbi:MAG: hypothetical protein ACFFD4_11500 [Candidatus Odinarchaeota archaeon]
MKEKDLAIISSIIKSRFWMVIVQTPVLARFKNNLCYRIEKDVLFNGLS